LDMSANFNISAITRYIPAYKISVERCLRFT
jgi:hypothetical protein